MKRNSEELRIGGFVPLTTADMPGNLSAVIFCQGCPWRCRYCHNVHLIDPNSKGAYKWSEILSFLERRRGLLDAVVFSGGEPTMQAALCGAIGDVVGKGFLVGLHTAGAYPAVLKDILPIISWVGFDIKAPIGEYQRITQRRAIYHKIEESISMVLSSGVPYEFRTTYHRALLSEKDVLLIAQYLADVGAKKYVLQSFRPAGCSDQELNSHIFPHQLSDAVYQTITELVEVVDIRTH